VIGRRPGTLLLLLATQSGCLVTPDAFNEARARFQDIDGDGFTEAEGDCAPTDPATWPGAPELCDRVDNDCDGNTDEDPTDVHWYLDSDGDGSGTPTQSQAACDAPDGYVDNADDCDDHDEDIGPHAAEACNDLDDDCNGDIDDGAPADRSWFPDADGDGYGDSTTPVAQCAPPGGAYVLDDGDCDTRDPLIHPGADERCNHEDDDCDGDVDEAPTVDPHTWYLDRDLDGWGDDEAALVQCTRPEGAYVLQGGDCNDGEPAIHPEAPETCNDIDDDCDGVADDPPTTGDGAWYFDLDGDGFGDENSSETTCDPEPGMIETGGDCDDTDDEVNPLATEVCNDGVDNDCDGSPNGCVWPSSADLADYIAIDGDNDIDSLGRGVAAGDIDGDGDVEVIAAAYYGLDEASDERKGWVYTFGAAALASQSLDDAELAMVGDSVSFIGDKVVATDLDGDGNTDLLVGASANTVHGSNYDGSVVIAYGPITGDAISDINDWQIDGDGIEDSDQFGWMVRELIDMNGDGLPELGVGAPRLQTSSYDGAAYVFYNADTGLSDASDADLIIQGNDEPSFLGSDLTATDLDGDGHADLAVGASDRSGYLGEVNIFSGPISGTWDASDSDFDFVGEGLAGVHIDRLNDINADGYDDIVVGSYYYRTAYMVWGTATIGTMSLSDADIKIRGDNGDEQFGYVVRDLGDLDGNGVSDLAVTSTATGVEMCGVYLFFGPMSTSAVLQNHADADSALMCDGLDDDSIDDLTAADVTGDGVPDLIAGAQDSGSYYQGTVYVVPGIGF